MCSDQPHTSVQAHNAVRAAANQHQISEGCRHLIHHGSHVPSNNPLASIDDVVISSDEVQVELQASTTEKLSDAKHVIDTVT